MKNKRLSLLIALATVLVPTIGAFGAENDTNSTNTPMFMNGFVPTPIVGELNSECWGAEDVGARDQSNGLEDTDLDEYSYWDGGIIKDEETGKYYMFASRWEQAGGHWGENGVLGWQGSKAIYAVSDNLYGPYEDKGVLWPDFCEGSGHNVFPFEVSSKDPLYEEGYRYAIVVADAGGDYGSRVNGTIHISKSLDGPWELMENENDGKMKYVGEGYSFSYSNICIMVRPDGRYEAINRNGDILIADSLEGEWEVQMESLWLSMESIMRSNIEDPVMWYADGMYHMIANKWDVKMAFYLTSEDGITWERMRGTAYRADKDFITYEGGTVNSWAKLERPNVYLEDGKLVAMTFAVIDVEKEADYGNDTHGSKVIVTAFDATKIGDFTEEEATEDKTTENYLVERNPDSNVNTMLVVAAVVGVCVLIAAVVLIVICVKKKKK